MPTQAELDKLQDRRKAHTGTIGIKAKSGGIHDLSTSFIIPPREFPQTGKRDLQDDGQDFVSRDRTVDEGDGGGGGGDTIDVIWCVNGEPYDGTVVGTIGDPL